MKSTTNKLCLSNFLLAIEIPARYINPIEWWRIAAQCFDGRVVNGLNEAIIHLASNAPPHGKRGKKMNTKKLNDEAVSLPLEERALIVDSLLRSLNQPESEIDKKWAIVAQRRLEEMKSGAVKAVPGQEVFDKVWKRFAK